MSNSPVLSDAVFDDDLREDLAPAPPTQLRSLPDAIGRPTAAVFGGLSKLRGKRAMHPFGLVVSATLRVPHDRRLPAAWRDLDGATGVVRLSKAVGLPGRIPDVLGLALRFGEQDLLLASAAGPAPGLQHLLVPAAGFDRTVFSSLLGHRVGGSVAVIQARLVGRLPQAPTYLQAVRAAGPVTLDFAAVGLLGGRRPLGVVTLGGAIESEQAAEVRFDPWRAGAGLEPVGPVQRLRAAAYAGSRRATRT